MYKYLAAIFFLTVLTVSSFGQKSAAAAKAEPSKSVKDAFERLLEGIRQLDLTKVMDGYEKGPRTLFFNNNGSITLGWDQMESNRKASYARTKDVSLTVEGVRVEMLGPKAAYVSCTWKQSQVYDGKLENAAGRMTLIFKLVGKDWKVVHLHTSPSAPAENRPVFDSEKKTDQ